MRVQRGNKGMIISHRLTGRYAMRNMVKWRKYTLCQSALSMAQVALPLAQCLKN
jgi:hypothetical protein